MLFPGETDCEGIQAVQLDSVFDSPIHVVSQLTCPQYFHTNDTLAAPLHLLQY